MVADIAVDSKDVLNGEVGDRNKYDVQADDDEGADGEVGNDGRIQAVQDLASIEYAKEEQYIDGVEEGDVQDMLPCIEGFQMPGKE